jgi:hypothetical protein
MPKQKDLLCSGLHEIPGLIRSNEPLCDITKKCLLFHPSRCPAAAQLCDMLVHVCRKAALRKFVSFLEKSYGFSESNYTCNNSLTIGECKVKCRVVSGLRQGLPSGIFE